MAEELEEPKDLSPADEDREDKELVIVPTTDDNKIVNKAIKETFMDLFAEDGYASGFTEEINGFLECVLIQSSTQIQIQITLERYPDIVVYQNSDFSGQKYLSLRNKTIAPNGEMFNFQAAKWSLNDGLRVEINGPKGASAHFVFKYS